ncbi:hypothetical protein Ddc_15445 [Ditylenchus destructor]|nr:hypothetical protein Ddc_15445 [Ditylenchus destructor]
MVSGKAINVLMVALVGMLLYSMTEVDATETNQEMERRLFQSSMYNCSADMYCRIAVKMYVEAINETERNRFYNDLINRFGFSREDLVRR